MKIAVCQINPVIGDINGNKEKILKGYRRATDDGADIAVFPELALTGYPPLDFVEKKAFRVKINEANIELARATNAKTGLIFGSITEFEDNVGTNIENSSIFCINGKISFIQNKSLIPNYDVFDEVRYFESASEVKVFEFRDEIIGLSVCEDIWNDEDYWKKRMYPVDPVKEQVVKGATLLINISASPYSYGKRKARYKMLSTLTKQDNVKLVYTCCAAAQTELIFDGASMCFDEKGNLAMLGKTFSEDYFIYDTKIEYSPLLKVEASFEEEVHNALIFGLKDYCNKLNFKSVCLGLSGGIDSAIVAYFAVKALDKESVFVTLMPSEFSSEGSITDSLKLVENLGIKHNIIPIQPVFETVKKMLDPVFNNKPEDVTEENMQSRIRGLYMMAISNKFNHLLVTTGNKSELATGYATLYGDMCGGLAIIGDVYKTDVYRLCKYINRYEEILPGEIIDKVPSAELRPNQTDQDSLPPYPVLDKILRMYLEENEELDEIASETGDRELVKKILNLVDRNEFKRKQGAPVLRVSNKAFGYGRRFPIVQRWSRE